MNKLKSRIKNQLTNATLAFMMKKDIKRWWERGVHTDTWKRMTFTGWEMSPEHVVWKVAFEPSRRTCLLQRRSRARDIIMRSRISVYHLEAAEVSENDLSPLPDSDFFFNGQWNWKIESAEICCFYNITKVVPRWHALCIRKDVKGFFARLLSSVHVGRKDELIS